MRTRRANHRGYTLIEVLMALAVLGTGVTGIVSMMNGAIYSNRRAHEMTMATQLARRWQERLRTDALLWNSPSNRSVVSDLGRDTAYLCRVVGCAGGAASVNQWFVPTAPAGRTETAAFDAFGNDVPLGATTVRYCTNLRLNWLRAETASRQGLIRAEIRVWWFREGATHLPEYDSCGQAGGLLTLGQDIQRLDFVYAATAVMGNPS